MLQRQGATIAVTDRVTGITYTNAGTSITVLKTGTNVSYGVTLDEDCVVQYGTQTMDVDAVQVRGHTVTLTIRAPSASRCRS